MSKFQVTKKDFLKHQSTFGNAPSNQQSASAKPHDGGLSDLSTDLAHEKSAKWRRQVMIKLQNESEASKAAHTPQSPPTKKRRIDMLAQPKIRYDVNLTPEPFRVRASALVHNASDRIQDLAMPKRRHAKPLNSQKDKENAGSFTDSTEDTHSSKKKTAYQISDRLNSLAQPRRTIYDTVVVPGSDFDANNGVTYVPMMQYSHNEYSGETKSKRMSRLVELTKIPRHKLVNPQEKKPGAVAYSALVCRASPRVEELAGPKLRRIPRENEFAFKTRPAALRYNPSERIENLAVARIRRAVANA